MSLSKELIDRNIYRKKITEQERSAAGSRNRAISDYCIERDKILAKHGMTIKSMTDITGERNQNLTALFKRNPKAFEMLAIGALCCYDRDSQKGAHALIDDIIKQLIASKKGGNRLNLGCISQADGILSELKDAISFFPADEQTNTKESI